MTTLERIEAATTVEEVEGIAAEIDAEYRSSRLALQARAGVIMRAEWRAKQDAWQAWNEERKGRHRFGYWYLASVEAETFTLERWISCNTGIETVVVKRKDGRKVGGSYYRFHVPIADRRRMGVAL